ncbi:YvaD family protein [Cytobacillus firmus]|uniref:YvaD family protein n=1 Tax=Cytobacillus firmus TaxID=1399 RepID=UPI0021616706|nr:YvaD family protein [Cytobacillus firmus]MCS0673511.1 YvaD family protein [Cytobacillus firmus]
MAAFFFWLTDVGFIVYWIITLLHIIPSEYLFKDYDNPILFAWNWSFFPLDILISITGFTSLFLYKKNNSNWSKIALISLVLTSCSGLQAISFWILRSDFDLSWWLPNLYLLIYPLFFIPSVIKENQN